MYRHMLNKFKVSTSAIFYDAVFPKECNFIVI